MPVDRAAPTEERIRVSTGELLFMLQGAACTFGRSLHLDDGGSPGWAIGGISRGLAVRGPVVPAARHGSARPVSYSVIVVWVRASTWALSPSCA